MTWAQQQLLESQWKRNKMPVRLPTMMSKYFMLQLHTHLYWKVWDTNPLLQFHLLFCSLRAVFASVHCWYRDSPFCDKSQYIVSCHRSDKSYWFLTMEFSFIPSAENMVFMVDEAAVQQVFPMLVVCPPLLYIPCHQGLVQQAAYQGLSLTSLLQLVQQAAVPGTQSHLTATAGKTGCSSRDTISPHCYSWYNRLQYQGLSLTSLLWLVQGVIFQHPNATYTAHVRCKNCWSNCNGNFWAICPLVKAAEGRFATLLISKQQGSRNGSMWMVANVKPSFFCDGILKLMRRQDRLINVLGYYTGK